MTENVPYYTQTEFASRLRVSCRTLRRWEQAGLLVPVRIAGTVRYRDSMLPDESRRRRVEERVDALLAADRGDGA